MLLVRELLYTLGDDLVGFQLYYFHCWIVSCPNPNHEKVKTRGPCFELKSNPPSKLKDEEISERRDQRDAGLPKMSRAANRNCCPSAMDHSFTPAQTAGGYEGYGILTEYFSPTLISRCFWAELRCTWYLEPILYSQGRVCALPQ